MSAVVRSKIFKSGNSVAVRLPARFGLAEGTEVDLEERASGIVMTRVAVPGDENRRLNQMIDEMEKLPRPTSVQQREPIEFRERPGL